MVGCVALKRLDGDTLEFARLIIAKVARNLGIATKLIERCITRDENNTKELLLQTTIQMPEAHKLYYKLGFEDKPGPVQMRIVKRTEKIMVMQL
ncbi:GNAT family N-acetyltransferase [Dyadobacter sp. NIV53]|uniref:GNAT family N-acetyltransferase n=1 Tax=Dyadobacter sp. NIV53 TaxID=2861765 RepID=UPI001C87D2A2|nr:GNAT family N-acetyltransferase [Dyadobacter sp. NIV53]